MKRNGGLLLPLLFLCEVARIRSSLITDFQLQDVVRLVPEEDLERVKGKMVHSHQWSDDSAHSHQRENLVRRLFQSDITQYRIFLS
jgi:hypothetical protein